MKHMTKQALMLAAILLLSISVARGGQCPKILSNANRLLMVTAPTMNSNQATIRQYIRDKKTGNWIQSGKSRRAALGHKGMGWGWNHLQHRHKNEPVKREGDKRTPAGFYSFGKSFGFKGKNSSTYLRLEHAKHICVDDIKSRHYNTITSRKKIGPNISGEKMRAIKLYEHGVIVNYPANRKKRAGSCIFLHLWRAPGKTTAGCIAMSRTNLRNLQAWVHAPRTVIGILPKSALGRFKGCLNGVAG